MSVDYSAQARRRAENALVRLVRNFSDEMREKLLEKRREGLRGWGCKQDERRLIREFKEHVEEARKPADYVDVANFAAFLWHIGRKKERK